MQNQQKGPNDKPVDQVSEIATADQPGKPLTAGTDEIDPDKLSWASVAEAIDEYEEYSIEDPVNGLIYAKPIQLGEKEIPWLRIEITRNRESGRWNAIIAEKRYSRETPKGRTLGLAIESPLRQVPDGLLRAWELERTTEEFNTDERKYEKTRELGNVPDAEWHKLSVPAGRYADALYENTLRIYELDMKGQGQLKTKVWVKRYDAETFESGMSHIELRDGTKEEATRALLSLLRLWNVKPTGMEPGQLVARSTRSSKDKVEIPPGSAETMPDERERSEAEGGQVEDKKAKSDSEAFSQEGTANKPEERHEPPDYEAEVRDRQVFMTSGDGSPMIVISGEGIKADIRLRFGGKDNPVLKVVATVLNGVVGLWGSGRDIAVQSVEGWMTIGSIAGVTLGALIAIMGLVLKKGDGWAYSSLGLMVVAWAILAYLNLLM